MADLARRLRLLGVYWLLTRLFFLRHAETEIDASRPVSEWLLTQRGEDACRALADSAVFDEVARVITSNEMKAVLTGEIVAERLGCEIVKCKKFRELDRGKSPVLAREEYEARVRRAMALPDQRVEDWESAEHAIARFKTGIEKVESEKQEATLIVSHGIILTLYFSELKNESKNAFERWSQLAFCAWGLTEGSTVLRDIID